METYKRTIADKLIKNEINNNRTLERIYDAIQWSWIHWNDYIISTYYTGDKPELPTSDFIQEWVENADFEADGYDIEYLKELFA